MPSLVSPVLVPYIEECLSDPCHVLLTSTLDVSTNWLVLRFINAALYGVDDEIKRRTMASQSSNDEKATVVFLSLLRSAETWVELGKKTNLDFTSLIAAKRLAYIDGLTVGIPNLPTDGLKSIKPRSHSLQDIASSITAAKESMTSTAAASTNSIVIIDGLDFVLASQPQLSHLQLAQLISTLRDQFSCVITTISADLPLLHNVEASATPLELNHSILARTISHQSTWVMQLRPLETGHAKDVSGVIRISKGGSHSDENDELSDGEWLYQVKGDGAARVWSRGE